MLYHGGPVMTGQTKVYLVFYGNFKNAATPIIINDFISNLGGSPYWNILTSYFDGAKNRPANSLVLAGVTNDNYSQGKLLDQPRILNIVTNAWGFQFQSNAIYLVLLGDDVNEIHNCLYTGEHFVQHVSGVDMKYGFISNSAYCNWQAPGQTSGLSPNDNLEADGMINTIAHELAEAVSDPRADAWWWQQWESDFSEIGDVCEGQYGATYSPPNGSVANVRLGSRDFYIQELFANGPDKCALSY
jgi:hypothetical protein